MNLEQLQHQHTNAAREARGLLERSQSQAEREGRTLTSIERAAIEAAVNEANNLKRRLDAARTDQSLLTAIDQMTGGLTRSASPMDYGGRDTLTRQIAQSQFGRFVAEHKGGLTAGGPSWTTPVLELVGGGLGGVPGEIRAATISEGGAGGITPAPDVIPVIVTVPGRELVVADLMGSGRTSSSSVQYMKETSVTNAATAVAEGAPKPESTIAFAPATEPVRKIATWIPLTEEVLEDIDGFSAYINGRLRDFVLLAEDDQLLNGSGIDPNFTGILHRPGLAAPVARVDPENNADAILRQITAIETATMMTVSGIVMNSANWTPLLQLKDQNGNYVAQGGPFGTPLRKTLWGKDVALTPAQTVGTATVGCFKSGAQFRRRTPVRVDASNSHQDFFIKNLVAVRAEERGALVVFRAAAFGLVTNLQ